jgi:hydrogenase nickel incorporation protein HypB
MCTTCGCGPGETRVAGKAVSDPEDAQAVDAVGEPPRLSGEGRAYGSSRNNPGAQDGQAMHTHQRTDSYRQGQAQAHSHAHGADHAHAPSATQESTTSSRMVQIERDILAKNDGYAAENRCRLEAQGIFALNLVSSPGSGKTSLLCRTIEVLKAELSIVVIEGDQQTSRDAERIRATGVAAAQINTGKGCHLDAHRVGHALSDLAPADDSLLLIENVGNLVCPAAFDLGEAHKVVILSVTEGEDKPLKYPGMFHAASLMLLNKVDLLPYLSFDSALAVRYALQVNPALQVIPLSATTGEGFEQWLAWLRSGCAASQERKTATVASLRRRIAELEARLSAVSGD